MKLSVQPQQLRVLIECGDKVEYDATVRGVEGLRMLASARQFERENRVIEDSLRKPEVMVKRSRSHRVLRWECVVRGQEWVAGDYRVWVQRRVREGNTFDREYAASYKDETPWLIDSCSLAKAKEACEQHAKERAS